MITSASTTRFGPRLLAGGLALVLLFSFGLFADQALAQQRVQPTPVKDLLLKDTRADGALADVSQSLVAAFENGDVFAAIAGGSVNQYRANGTFVQTLSHGSGFTTGMAFDENDNLYVTKFSESAVDVFNSDGVFVGTFGSGYSTPESIVFDAAGNVYVGNLGNGLRMYNAAGNFIRSFATGRVDFFDLAADQCTVYYGREASTIHAYDICADTVLPNFAVGGGLVNAYAMRILPDGGLLVANGPNVVRLNNAGTVVQTYTAPGVTGGWFALNLDPDGTSFWSGSFTTGTFFKIDIASGAILLGPINTGCGGNCFFGLAVFGEIAVAVSADLSLEKSASPSVVGVGGNVTFTLEVTNNGPSDATNVVVTDVLPPQFAFSSSTDCTESGGTVTCNLGSIPNGGTASASFVATALSAGSVVNTASVTGNQGDPVPDNNTDSATVLIEGDGEVDTTAPVCGAIVPEFEGPDGALSAIATSAADPESGIATVRFTSLQNLHGSVDGVGPYAQGDTHDAGGAPSVAIRGERVSYAAGGRLVVLVTNGAGLTRQCDPVVSRLDGAAPEATALLAAYPNPARAADAVAVPFRLAEASAVRLAVYDVLGREVAVLADGAFSAGPYEARWAEASALPAGAYVVRLEAGALRFTQRLTLVR